MNILNKLKLSKAVPTSLLIYLYGKLADIQIRCYPYLQELLVDTTFSGDELRWEVELAKARVVSRICETR